jgi:hypothetical protein
MYLEQHIYVDVGVPCAPLQVVICRSLCFMVEGLLVSPLHSVGGKQGGIQKAAWHCLKFFEEHNTCECFRIWVLSW